MQRAETKTLALFTDADGCIYNPHYLYLLLHIIKTHGDFFMRYGGRHRQAFGLAQEMKINEIIDEINKIPVYKDGKSVEFTNIDPVGHLIHGLLSVAGYDNYEEELDDDEINEELANIVNIYLPLINNLDSSGQKLIKALLYAANKPYFAENINRARAEEIEKIDLISGSNRQSKSLDDHNIKQNGTGSFFVDLETICEIFNEKLKEAGLATTCIHDRFSMADIYADFEFGESYTRILNEYKMKMSHQHEEYIFDETKFSLLYAVLNHVAIKYENENVTLAFFEDRNEHKDDIIPVLTNIFVEHPDLIPQNVSLEIWNYNGNLPENKDMKGQDKKCIEAGGVLVIQGTSLHVDYNFRNNVKMMAKMCGHPENKSINAARELDINSFKQQRILACTMEASMQLTLEEGPKEKGFAY